jgi:ABC-type antimicrobial peptide transport system permease subunit
VKAQIWALNKNQSIYSVSTIEEGLARWLAPRRFNLVLLGSFSALALVLSAVGIYGLVSFATAQRTSEIGVRIALGAGAPDILAMVMRQGLRLTLLGVALGVAGALALTRLLRGMLFGVTPTDPATFLAIALLVLGVAALATYLPARRAARLDPVVAIRSD